MQKRFDGGKTDSCPFCGSSAYTKNSDGVPVCTTHKNSSFGNMKCVCGSFLDLREGKWGPFFLCEKCGPVNMRKAIELNPPSKAVKEEKEVSKKSHPMMGDKVSAYKKPTDYVRSDDARYEFR